MLYSADLITLLGTNEESESTVQTQDRVCNHTFTNQYEFTKCGIFICIRAKQ